MRKPQFSFTTLRQILDDTLAVLSLGKLCEEHGYSFEWTSGLKHQQTPNGKIILCNTENCVPIVVPGLSTGSSSSSESSSTFDDTSSSPATKRCDDTSAPAPENRSRDPTKTPESKNKIGIAFRHQKTDCETCRSGWRSSEKI